MKKILIGFTVLIVASCGESTTNGSPEVARAEAQAEGNSCNKYLLPRQEINGQMVGQESCQMKEADVDYLVRGSSFDGSTWAFPAPSLATL